MTTREQLDSLSSHELHDRAVHLAVRRLDVRFLWDLLRELPAGEVASGHSDVAAADVTRVSAMISDALASGQGDIADSLRPFYLDYLEKHGSQE
jgi:hypothetical protein